MSLNAIYKLGANPIAGVALLLTGLLIALFFDVYLNCSYSNLQQADTFNGDFVDILGQGKLRILLTRDNSKVAYLPRQGASLAEQQRIAALSETKQ